MSQIVEISVDTQCYLCDSFFAQSQGSYVVYKCFCCMKFTPYCISCEIKIQKLFGRGNFFKCMHCNKLTNAIDKLEINPSNQQKNLSQANKGISLNNSFYKTPTKPFIENSIPISSIKGNNSNNNYIINSQNNEERKDSNSIGYGNNTMLSNFINEFKMINLALNSNSNKNDIYQKFQSQNISNNVNDSFLNKTICVDKSTINSNKELSEISNRTLKNSGSMQNILDCPLLKSKTRLNRRFCLNNTFLGKKRDESDNKSEFRGYNKSREKNTSINNNQNYFGTVKSKRLITRNMSKIYKSENNMNNTLNSGRIELKPAVNNFKREKLEIPNIVLNRDGSFGFPLFNEPNIRSNLFVNDNPLFTTSSNSINGKATPHRILDNSDGQYF